MYERLADKLKNTSALKWFPAMNFTFLIRLPERTGRIFDHVL